MTILRSVPLLCVFLLLILASASAASSPTAAEVSKYIPLLREHIYQDYQGMFRAEGGAFKYPFLTPGSTQYGDVLWDWDSWLSNVALRQILLEKGTKEEQTKTLKYEQGCILNFLNSSVDA